MSPFATPRDRSEEEDVPMLEMDESKMERAMNFLARETEQVDENDPRQAVNLMRKLTDMSGLDMARGWKRH